MRIWLDDERPAPAGFLHLTKAVDAIASLQGGLVTEISLDHDLGDGPSGYIVAKVIEELAYQNKIPRLAWAVHSMNPVGVKNMRAALAKANEYWDKHEREAEEEKKPGRQDP
jgi:hypothetical protein